MENLIEMDDLEIPLFLGNTHILVYKGPFTNLPKIVICKIRLTSPWPESAGGIGSSWNRGLKNAGGFSKNSLSHRIHVWYIYLHLDDFYGKCR